MVEETKEMPKNIFYFKNLNIIGGIETFFYQLARKYKDWDITIYYSSGDSDQIKRLKRFVKVKQYKGEKIKCEKAFFNFNIDIIDNVDANEYGLILHGDYKDMINREQILSLPVHKRINKYYGVSQLVCDSFKEITGIDAELLYNPMEIEKPKRILYLISATRLTKEKGKDRIEKLAKMLDENNIPYIWLIFTDDVKTIENCNIIYMKPRLNITDYIAKADYLVQLSDNEGYCYAIVESLCLGVPIIATKLPVLKELGANESNSFLLDFDLNDVPIKEIYEKKFYFKYTPKASNWDKVLAKGKSTYKEELNMRYEVEALEIYEKESISDSELKRVPKAGERFIVSKERLDVLLGENPHNKVFVKLIGEVNDKNKVKEDTVEKEAVKKKITSTKKIVKK